MGPLLLRIGLPLLLALGVFAWGYSSGSASKQRAWDLATAAQVTAQVAASEAARAAEAAHEARIKEAQRARQTENSRNERIAADLRADADRLRGDIAAFAGGPAEDSIAACDGRAATLGELLGDALRTSQACAGQAEDLGGDLRSVLEAWPREPLR